MNENNNYVICIDNKSNKIVSVEKMDTNELDVVYEHCEDLNKEASEQYRYLPVPHCKRVPRVGFDSTQELKDIIAISPETPKKAANAMNEALRIIMSIHMTITSTRTSLLPDVSVEECCDALVMVAGMIMMLQRIHCKHEDEEKEKKETVDELFKQLGINTKGE